MKDDHYKLIMLYTVFVMVLTAVCVGSCVHGCGGKSEQRDTVTVEYYDTIYRWKHDTLPAERERKVVRYVHIPVPVPSDSVPPQDSTITLPVIQKSFSDDSTYTAYVSGVGYEDYPKLDSISVRMREISHTIKETVTVRDNRHWRIGITAGPLYDFVHGNVGAGITFGLTYNF